MPTFAREAQMDIRDLVRTGFEPSRAVGPPDPEAPENTWLRGYTPAVAPVGMPSQPLIPSGQPTLTQSPELAMEQSGEPLPEILLFETGFTNFGNEGFVLRPEELSQVVDIVLGAYERVLTDRAKALRARYTVQPNAGPNTPMQEPSPAGEEVVRAVLRPQAQSSLPAPPMPFVWESSDAGPSDVREVPRKKQRNKPAPSGPRLGLPRVDDA